MLKNRLSLIISLILLGSLLLMALVSLFWTPHDPFLMDTNLRLAGPSLSRPLGSDSFGRDLLSRMMIATRMAIIVAVGSVLIGGITGISLGTLSAATPRLGRPITSLINVLMAFPGILLALVLLAIFGAGLFNTIMALGVMSLPRFARITKALVIQLNEREFVLVAQTLGRNPLQIFIHHMLPNMVSPLLLTATLSASGAVLSEAGLSFLGLGVQPPSPSWGYTLNEAKPYILSSAHFGLAPAGFIICMVFGLNLLSDALSQQQKI